MNIKVVKENYSSDIIEEYNYIYDKHIEKGLNSFDFYITKDILNSKYGDLLLNMLEFENYNKDVEINLYCDFANNQNLINKLENTFKIKFSSINNNPYKIISHIFFTFFNRVLKFTPYLDFCEGDLFKGIYSTETLESKSIVTILDILAEMLSYKKYIIVKMNKEYFDMKSIYKIYAKIIDFDDKELFDIKKTFLGLYLEYINNPKDFNKNYKDIKYYAFDNQHYIFKKLIEGLKIKKDNLKDFIDIIGIDIDFINKLLNYKSKSITEAIFLINDYNIANEYINKVANKNEQYQIVFLTSLICMSSDFIKGNAMLGYLEILFNFNIYIKFKDKLKKALNVSYYITKNEYNENLDKEDNHTYTMISFKIEGSNCIYTPKSGGKYVRKYIKYLNDLFYYNTFISPFMEKFFILKNKNILNSFVS